jgi:hypothetical protein
MIDHELLRLDRLPAYQNKAFASREAAQACPRGQLLLVQDGATGLVSNRAFDPALIRYDGSYQNEQGHSPTFLAHMGQVAEIIGRRFSGLSMLEIGCGKGLFLDILRDAGHDARGIDPAYEGTAAHVIKQLFAPGIGVHGEAVILRHVLEHIQDPETFLRHIRAANGGSGLIYVEVPCLDWILARRAWFDFFYEHVNYFRIADFRRLFGEVLETGHVFGGQYIYVIARLDSLRDPADPRLGQPPPLAMPEGLFDAVDRCARLAADSPGTAPLIWGAAAKGVMFAHHLAERGIGIGAAVDINPAKQGHFLPGTGLPVLSPAQALAAMAPGTPLFVMNSNYLPEIRAVAGSNPNYITVDQQ